MPANCHDSCSRDSHEAAISAGMPANCHLSHRPVCLCNDSHEDAISAGMPANCHDSCRSAKAGQHYVSFTKPTAHLVLQNVQSMPDATLRRISDQGQHFAYTYLSQHAKALYVRQALKRYNAMFGGGGEGGGDMPALMEGLQV